MRWLRRFHKVGERMPRRADVKALGWQCPECGVPMDVVEFLSWLTGTAGSLRVEPCGHEVVYDLTRSEWRSVT